MTIELYTAPKLPKQAEQPEAPIASLVGELPDQEPILDEKNLLGSFPSREEAVNFIQNQLAAQQQEIVDEHSAPFSQYTHVEWLTLTIKTADQQTDRQQYYLVTDEGY